MGRMELEVLTRQDLEDFRQQLLSDIKHYLQPGHKATEDTWMKTYEVKEMLGVSSGTLQTMRDKGILAFAKFGGLVLYKKADIINYLEQQKTRGNAVDLTRRFTRS